MTPIKAHTNKSGETIWKRTDRGQPLAIGIPLPMEDTHQSHPVSNLFYFIFCVTDSVIAQSV
jgi:hypothetical protein